MTKETIEVQTSAPVTLTINTAKADKPLNEIETKQANELAKLCPAIVAAVREVDEFEAGLRDKYFRLCEAIRETQIPMAAGASRSLNRRETTLLLRSLGYSKSRVSEINRVVEVPPELWAKFKERSLGFRAVLTLARGDDPEAAAEADQVTDGTPQGDDPGVAPVSPKERPKLPKALAAALGRELAQDKWAKLKVTKGDDSYEDVEFLAHGKKFTVRLFVDKA